MHSQATAKNQASARALRAQSRARGVKTDSGILWLLWLGFADDLAIFANSEGELQKALELLYAIFRRFGLQMSLIKTETMIMMDEFSDEDYPTTICSLDDQALKNVKNFKYLGQKFIYNEAYTAECELMTRKMSAITSFYKENDKFYKNHNISIKTRRKIFDSLFRSKLTYACQTWSTTEASLKKILTTYITILRNLVKGGTTRKKDVSPDEDDDNNALVLTNEEIYKHTSAKPLIDFIEEQQLNWFAHIVRLPNTSTIKRLTFSTEKRKRMGPALMTLRKTITSRYEKTEADIITACQSKQQSGLLEFRKIKDCKQK